MQPSDLLWLGCCWHHFFSVRVLMMVFLSLMETCLTVPQALPLSVFDKLVGLLISVESAMIKNPLED